MGVAVVNRPVTSTSRCVAPLVTSTVTVPLADSGAIRLVASTCPAGARTSAGAPLPPTVMRAVACGCTAVTVRAADEYGV